MAMTNWALNINCNSIHVSYWGYFNFFFDFFIKHIFKKSEFLNLKLFGLAMSMFNANFLFQIVSLFLQNQPKT